MSTTKLALLLCVFGVAVCVEGFLPSPGALLSPLKPPPRVATPKAAASSPDSESDAAAGLSAGRVDAAYVSALGGIVMATKSVQRNDFELWLKSALQEEVGLPKLEPCNPMTKDGKSVIGGVSGRCATGLSCTDAGGVILRSSSCGAKTPICCVAAAKEVTWDETKVASAPTSTSTASAGNSDAGGLSASATTVTTSSANYSATPAFKVGSVPFAPAGTAVYWPLQWANATQRNYSVICYAKDSKTGIQHPTTPAAGTPPACVHSGKGKKCYGCSVRKFLALRSKGKRYHSGIDLYAPKGTPIHATEDGEIVNVYPFFENVCCVIVQTKSGIVINYGEIDCTFPDDIKIGKSVTAGQKIGEVGHLKCCHPMMHFEIYIQGTTQNLRSYPGAISASLLNPTEYLLHALEFGK